MSKVVTLSSVKTACLETKTPTVNGKSLPAQANLVTASLIQQALNDACLTKDWKNAKKKIDTAIKRGYIHAV